MSREHDSGQGDCGAGCEPLHNNPSRARTGNFTLEAGKLLPPEQWAVRGKPESGAHVSVELSVQRALELAQLILSQALGCTERSDTIYLSLVGELREDPDR